MPDIVELARTIKIYDQVPAGMRAGAAVLGRVLKSNARTLQRVEIFLLGGA
ncbi:hypothetical protein [Hyphomicrobium sp.]|uniref:hypothetical protein n=1 Tax=Hyphomicrobium sp. TaxID=82 RepID=UPI002FE009E5